MSERIELCARMSSVERAGPWELPRELELRAFWGNLELDLREATFEPGTTTFDVKVTMGNIELIVPPSIEVRLEASTFAASIEQSAAPSWITPPAEPGTVVPPVIAPPTADKRVLRITGRVRFGNLEIIRLWPGESRRDAWRKDRHERRHHHHRHGGWHARMHHEIDALSGHRRDDERDARDAAEWEARVATRDAEDAAREARGRHERPGSSRAERRRRRHRRWRDLHAERDLWRRARDRGQPWRPWWLMARMRRRIFLWLALSLGGGIAIGWRLTEQPRWWWIAIAAILLSMVSGAIAFRLTRPLIMVVKAAREIGDGKLDTRLDVEHHGGETRVLASAINDMAEKIEQQVADQKQLLAAVSHELRTPLGHMRVLVETAREPSASPKALAEIEREILVLDDLVGKLLASSRLEFGNLDRRPIDLGELVGEAVLAAGVPPEAIEATDNVKAAVDPTLIRRAIANLLDNARVHGNGAIAVRVERRAGQIAVEVDDAGPGVPADKREEAFRAFSPSSGGGLGLGLALVSRIAVAHGGGAWITDRPGGGARIGFTVQA